nr:ribonuclease H-like domain-containing protein [Tanacetum cinerariifolium]
MDSQSTPVVSATKLPILNPNEFDIWKMRIEQYFLMIDYSLWEVIINGDSPVPTFIVEGAVQLTAILTTKQKLARKNKLKAHGTLLMALPDKHQLKLNSHKDAKTLMEAIEKHFGGNTTHTLIWRNKANLEEHSLDDLFNSLRIYEAEVKHSSSSVSAATSVSSVCAQLPVSSHPNIDCLSNAIDVDDLEEMDLRWQMAMLTMRARRSQPSGEYHVVPPPIRGNFMPPKLDLVFHTALIAVETTHSAFTVQLSLAKLAQDISHATRTMAPIIEDWVSDSEDESKPNDPQNATPNPTSSKTNGSSKRKNIKTCFVCRGVDHLIKDCNFHAKSKTQPTPRNSAHRGYDKQYALSTKKYPQKRIVPAAVLTKSKPVSVIVARLVSADVPKIMATKPRHARSLYTKTNSLIRRHETRSNFSKTSNLSPKVSAAHAKAVSAAKGNKGKWGNPQYALKDKGVIDSGCSRHMTGNMSYFFDFQKLNGGYVAFGGNPKGGNISGKGKIKTGKLDFEDVYFIKVLKFNLFSVSQMCDKKHKVFFTDSECLILSSDFKLPDESQVLLRVPRENNMYNVNLKDIVPSGDLTCLFAKVTIDESNLWHRRLGHINFKTINKLVKGNLVRGLPTKVFENQNTCVACKKGKQYRASCKTKPVSSVTQPLFRLHMDLFGPTFVKSLSTGPTWLFDIDSLTRIINYQPVTTGNQSNPSVGFQKEFDAGKTGEEANQQYMLFPVWSTSLTNPQNKEGAATFDGKEHDAEKPESTVNLSPSSSALSGEQDNITRKKNKGKSHVDYFTGNKDFNEDFEDYFEDSSNDVSAASPIVPTAVQNYSNSTNPISAAGPSNSNTSLIHGNSLFQIAAQSPDMLESEDIVYSNHENVGAEADFNNLETSITVSLIPTTRIHNARIIP